MLRARHVSIVAIALLFAACGSGTAGSPAKNGILLRAADVGDMRIRTESPVLNAFAFDDAVGHGLLFKDPVKQVVDTLKSYGFQRGYAEQFVGAGMTAGAFVAQFAPGKDLSGMLKYMNGNLFEECPGEPQCSIKTVLAVPSIPGSDGQVVHPTRGPTEGGDITVYKVIFNVGSLIFGTEIGGDDVYDPGTVSKSTALAAFKDFYDKVKSESADSIFNAAPKNGRGPLPPGPQTAISVPPGTRPPASPSSSARAAAGPVAERCVRRLAAPAHGRARLFDRALRARKRQVAAHHHRAVGAHFDRGGRVGLLDVVVRDEVERAARAAQDGVGHRAPVGVLRLDPRALLAVEDGRKRAEALGEVAAALAVVVDGDAVAFVRLAGRHGYASALAFMFSRSARKPFGRSFAMRRPVSFARNVGAVISAPLRTVVTSPASLSANQWWTMPSAPLESHSN